MRGPLARSSRSDPWEEPLQWRAAGRVVLIGLAVIAVYAWSVQGTRFSLVELVRGLPDLWNLFTRMVPPDARRFSEYLGPAAQTIQIALLGTSMGALAAVPLGLIAARNVSPHQVICSATRVTLNALRAIPELVWALLFVAAVGLGAFPGVIAIFIHATGVLGKLYSESIESIDPRPVEAVRAVGADRTQLMLFSVLPQALPLMLSYVIYSFEGNVRSATVLGLIGAGGIGFEMQQAMRLFKYQEMTTILLITLAMVTLIDYVSGRVRARLV